MAAFVQLDLLDQPAWVSFGWSHGLPTSLGGGPPPWCKEVKLRGIVGTPSTVGLSAKSVAAGTTKITDWVDATGPNPCGFWVRSLLHGGDLDTWVACLLATDARSADSVQAAYCALEHRFSESIPFNEEVSLGDIVQRLKDSKWQFIGLTPIALMSAYCTAVGYEGYVHAHGRLNHMLRVLPGSDDGQVVRDWLLGTRSWTNTDPESVAVPERWKPLPVDLLVEFVMLVNELADQGDIERDGVFASAMTYVEELQERRDALG